MNKLLYSGISLISMAAVGLIFAVVMEISTEEPVFYLVMKVAAGCFGIGGPVLGLGIVRRGRGRR